MAKLPAVIRGGGTGLPLALLFLAAFLFMELLWRLLFEYLIAFLQMREALLILQQARGLGT